MWLDNASDIDILFYEPRHLPLLITSHIYLLSQFFLHIEDSSNDLRARI